MRDDPKLLATRVSAAFFTAFKSLATDRGSTVSDELRRLAEEELEKSKKRKKGAKPPAAERRKKQEREAAARPDVWKLVSTLERCVLANGRPAHLVDAGSWPTPARLLLDRDGRELEEALSLIRWATSDDFWRANVLSMVTFRRKYDTLRLQAARGKPATKDKHVGKTGAPAAMASFVARRLKRSEAEVEAAIRRLTERTGEVPVIEAIAKELVA